mmetsp:Transcript_10727/g.28131  ORF Transcript_10727/g.28131 Transcript_10727/m.28131 type:complete len:214 (-) Transcript_10727:222-863(-)
MGFNSPPLSCIFTCFSSPASSIFASFSSSVLSSFLVRLLLFFPPRFFSSSFPPPLLPSLLSSPTCSLLPTSFPFSPLSPSLFVASASSPPPSTLAANSSSIIGREPGTRTTPLLFATPFLIFSTPSSSPSPFLPLIVASRCEVKPCRPALCEVGRVDREGPGPNSSKSLPLTFFAIAFLFAFFSSLSSIHCLRWPAHSVACIILSLSAMRSSQ